MWRSRLPVPTLPRQISLHLPLRDALSLPRLRSSSLRSVTVIPRQPSSQNSRQSKHNPLTPQISKLWLGRSRQSGASVAALRSRGLSYKCRLHRRPSPQTVLSLQIFVIDNGTMTGEGYLWVLSLQILFD